MSSDKKKDEDTGAEEPRPDETVGDGRKPDETQGDETRGAGIEDAEVLGETVADGSRFDHDAPTDDTSSDAKGDVGEDYTTYRDEDDMPPSGVATHADDTGDEPDANRPYAPDDAEPLSAASAGPDAEPGPTPSVTPVAAPSPPPQPAKSGGGFMPALLGGVIAAGLGFGAAHYDVAGMLGMQSGPDPVAESLSEMEARIASLAKSLEQPASGVTDQIAAQLGQISETLGGQLQDVAGSVGAVSADLGGALSGVTSQLGDFETRLGALDTGLGDIGTTLGNVTERLTAVERRPLTESSEAAQAAFNAYDRDIADLQEQLSQLQGENADLTAQLASSTQAAQSDAEAAQARAADLQAKAEADAKAAEARAAELQAQAEAEVKEVAAQADALADEAATREALANLDTAIYTGEPFETPLAKLADKGEIPEVLTAQASTGVASLPALRESFDPAARTALDASIRADVGDEPTSRITAFVRAQTGLRSLAPREGEDPDAVLSRADAAVDAGDLETALSELETLPDPGQAAMADWVAQAKTRLAVTQAASTLPDTLLAN